MATYVPDPTDETQPVAAVVQAQTAAPEFQAIKAHIKYNVLPLVAGRAPISSPNFTDVPTAPTALPGTATTQLATTAFVAAAALAATLPGAAGAEGLSLTSDGVDAAFRYSVPDSIAVLNYIGF